MIKFEIDPKRLIDMIRMGLVNGSLNEVCAVFNPTEVILSDITKGTIGSYAVFNKSYFKTYEVDVPNQKVIFRKGLIAGLSDLGFTSEETVIVNMDDKAEKMYVTSPLGKKWDAILSTDANTKQITFGLERIAGVGILPADKSRVKNYHSKIPVKLLTDNLAKAEKVTFVPKGTDILVKMSYDGDYEGKITLKPEDILIPADPEKPREYTLFVEYLRSIIANFTENVHVVLYDLAMITTSEGKTKENLDYILMYFCSTSSQ